MVRSAEVCITPVYCAGIFGVFDEELQDTFFVVCEARAFDCSNTLGFSLMYLFEFAFGIEEKVPIVIIDLFRHIKGGAVTGSAEFCDGTEGFGIILLCGNTRCTDEREYQYSHK